MQEHAAPLEAFIGHTPLIELRRLTDTLPSHVQVALKAEWFNPGGSVKDRAAYAIVHQALRDGTLKLGGTLLDASSGNTGIAYAMLGAALGFKVALCVPDHANAERKHILRTYGAHLILTDPSEGSDGAILQARRLAAAEPTRYFYADQYSNPANWQAHWCTTGPELVKQTHRQLTHFVAGLGTTGTCVGVGRYLRARLPAARVVAVQPSEPLHGLEGLKHLPSALVPSIYDASVPHMHATCSTSDAYATARQLALQEGLRVGISAGAAVHVALKLAQQLATQSQPAYIVALAPDGGDRYVSERFWLEDAGQVCTV